MDVQDIFSVTISAEGLGFHELSRGCSNAKITTNDGGQKSERQEPFGQVRLVATVIWGESIDGGIPG